MGSYRILEHPSDLLVEAEGTDFCDLVKALYEGIFHYVVEDALSCLESSRLEIDLDPEDGKDDWLVTTMNELIFLLYFRQQILTDCEIGESRLILNLRKCRQIRFSVEIKSATYHDLRLEERDGRVSGRVLFDL